MIKEANAIRRFSYVPEAFQNPYIGFSSFQHFRGEKMYSDIVVRPENNLTETERVECYPVSHDAEENGRNEGYHPDTSLVYIRILWKEFEPKRGEYNYKFIEDILEETKKHKQHLIFRLMAHSTRACDDVPDWLKEIIPCPERPDGMRLKDSPTDPRFLEYFLQAVKVLGERFDGDEALYAVDISLPGSWGEGHKLELYPDDTLERIVDVYAAVFKNTILFTQVARPALLAYGNERAIVGWRGDGLGSPAHTKKIYPPNIAQMEDAWRTAPVSFEAYWWLCEWKRKGWDIDEIIEMTLFWHISSFNAKSMPIPEEWKDKIDDWVRRMGYHYVIDAFAYPETVTAGDTARCKLRVSNVGVAPIYKKIPLKARLVGNGIDRVITLDTDIRDWLPGAHEVTVSIPLDDDIAKGTYTVEIGIMNEYTTLCFATDAEADGSFYKVAELTVEEGV